MPLNLLLKTNPNKPEKQPVQNFCVYEQDELTWINTTMFNQ